MVCILHRLDLLRLPLIYCLMILKADRAASRALEGMVSFVYSPLVLFSIC